MVTWKTIRFVHNNYDVTSGDNINEILEHVKIAIEYERVDVLDYLLIEHMHLIEDRIRWNLDMAVSAGKMEVVKLMTTHGIRGQSGDYGFSLTQSIYNHTTTDMLEYFLANFLDTFTESHMTDAIQTAGEGGKQDMIILLLDTKHHFDALVGKCITTCIHFNQTKAIHHLLEITTITYETIMAASYNKDHYFEHIVKNNYHEMATLIFTKVQGIPSETIANLISKSDNETIIDILKFYNTASN